MNSFTLVKFLREAVLSHRGSELCWARYRRSPYGTLWSTVARVQSGRRTGRPAVRLCGRNQNIDIADARQKIRTVLRKPVGLSLHARGDLISVLDDRSQFAIDAALTGRYRSARVHPLVHHYVPRNLMMISFDSKISHCALT